MEPLVVVKGEVSGKALMGVTRPGIVVEIDFFVLHAAPQALSKDVYANDSITTVSGVIMPGLFVESPCATRVTHRHGRPHSGMSDSEVEADRVANAYMAMRSERVRRQPDFEGGTQGTRGASNCHSGLIPWLIKSLRRL